ncbi:RNA polymerase sigma factor, sigma-70 family [Fodinibius roseus]|uniref:RNA polymerase sigma factor, sigma-70 family n=1 Tax=Fodinibius roseus TaxID=1194090 RepID=A0A1M5AUU2_9BACT|nr:sigma-70 family RNA polymerase sigma factor [Fodinibius roseus]SHF33896.1 RNA polymerase sigma factor, sigma-70 family [Fodinibius roseus]
MLAQMNMVEGQRTTSGMDLDELWRNVRSGKEKALSQLFCVSYSWLFKYGYRIVPREAFVKDAIQELFLILWEKRASINEARSVRSYLCSSLRRLIFRRMRKKNNRTKRNYRYNQHYAEELHNREELIVQFEDNQEKERRLSLAIGSLSDRQKEAIFLKYYDGLTNTEIARIMDINKQSVYNHVSAAIRKMQDYVQG